MKRPLLLSVVFGLVTSGWCGAAAPKDKPVAPKESHPRPKPVDPPPAPKAITDSIDRGVAFLLKDQNKDGSWGTPTRTKALNIYTPVPDGHQAYVSHPR